jgi:Kef-type K+ transport system membrane component KefB
MWLARTLSRHWIFLIGTFALLGVSTACHYPTVVGSMAESNPGTHFLWIAIILLVAKLSNLVVRYGQPPVLGELLVGVLFGNLSLAGFYFFEPIRQDLIIRFLAELGVVILLFQVGLESNVKKMLRVGPRAFLVAWIGVLVPCQVFLSMLIFF